MTNLESPLPRKLVDKTIRFSRGSAHLSSGAISWKTWGGKFLLRVQGEYAGGYALLTAGQARKLAAELIRRAEYQEAGGR